MRRAGQLCPPEMPVMGSLACCCLYVPVGSASLSAGQAEEEGDVMVKQTQCCFQSSGQRDSALRGDRVYAVATLYKLLIHVDSSCSSCYRGDSLVSPWTRWQGCMQPLQVNEHRLPRVVVESPYTRTTKNCLDMGVPSSAGVRLDGCRAAT